MHKPTIIALMISLALAMLAGAGRLRAETIYECPGEGGASVYTNRPGQGCTSVRLPGGPQISPALPPATSLTPQPAQSDPDNGNESREDAGRNEIKNAGQGLAMLFAGLARLEAEKKGLVTVYHLGDSHVRSDDFPAAIARGLQSRFGKPGDAGGNSGLSYHAYGINGKTFRYFSSLRDMPEHLKKWRPDLVLVTLGTNDAFARRGYSVINEDLSALFNSIKRVSPESSILFTVPPDSFFKDGTVNRYIAVVRQVITDFCAGNGCAWWDLYSVMGGRCSMNSWRERGLARRDRIHCTPAGYRLMGEMLSSAIQQAYERYTVSADDNLPTSTITDREEKNDVRPD